MYSMWNYKPEDILPPNSTNPPGPTSTKLYSPQQQLKSTLKQIQHILILSVFNIICFCLFVKCVVYHRFSVRTAYSLWDILVECCFTSTETVGLLGTVDSHLDLHTASGSIFETRTKFLDIASSPLLLFVCLLACRERWQPRSKAKNGRTYSPHHHMNGWLLPARLCTHLFSTIKFYAASTTKSPLRSPVCIHMGSSSVLVLIGSHSLCNSFVVNQFLFFTPNGENSLCYTPKKQWEQYGGKKMFCLFFISKIYSHVTQKWRPKTGMAIPYCLC